MSVTGVDGSAAEARSLYLDLLKRCLTFLLWSAQDQEILELRLKRPLVSLARVLQRIGRLWKGPDPSVREAGHDWPAFALTMVGMARLDNVQQCVENVLRNDIPGDLIEAGVWRGGVPILMRGILRAHGVLDRVVWVADSFAGCPKPSPEYPADRDYDLTMYSTLAVPLDEVRGNFERFQLLDDQVRFLKGWFKDTLPEAPIERLAVMRLDGDLYESTLDGLVSLYPKLSVGGYAIVDDYQNSPPCRLAVDYYRELHGIHEPIANIDWSGVYWQKARHRPDETE